MGDVGERSAGRGGGCELKVIMSSIPSTMFVICGVLLFGLFN